ncbi:hypothetical protein BH24CHL6_BH24CHL6_12720 [soil metagenome]
MAEFAIFLPILLLIMLIAVDLGRVYMGLISVNNMARIGANYAALNPTAWQAPDSKLKGQQRARYETLMRADATSINCTLPSALAAPNFGITAVGGQVQVEVDCDFPLITPFLSTFVGAADGDIPIYAAATFTIRTGSPVGVGVGGGSLPTADPGPTPPPTAAPTATPTDAPSPDPDASPGPTPTATPTIPPVTVGFHGTPTSTDSEGGGIPGSEGENQVVGVPTLSVIFSNTTVGTMGSCLWQFGDGATSSSCGNTVNKTYSTRGTYHVTLTVNGQALTRTGYVLVGCKVPSFAGARRNYADDLWVAAGFSTANLTALPGKNDGEQNYIITYQTLAGGMLNPPGGCSGATISVGP